MNIIIYPPQPKPLYVHKLYTNFKSNCFLPRTILTKDYVPKILSVHITSQPLHS